MDAVVVRQFGMERRRDDRAVPDEHRLAVDRGEHVDVGAGALDDWSTDEDGVERTIVETLDGEIALEAVDLTSERVAADIDVEHPEAALISTAVEHGRRQQDHA